MYVETLFSFVITVIVYQITKNPAAPVFNFLIAFNDSVELRNRALMLLVFNTLLVVAQMLIY